MTHSMRRRQNPFIVLPAAFSFLLAAAALASPLLAADLVQGVRSKLSAADLASGEAAVETYRLAKGVDPEYLNAVGWLARGANPVCITFDLFLEMVPAAPPEIAAGRS